MKAPAVSDFDLSEYERRRERDRKRRVLATIVATKGQTTATINTIEEVLRAVREAGYLIIDKDRVVEVRTSHRFHEDERDLVPKLLDHVRKTAALQIGRHMLDKGGIEFEELDGGRELRSTAYVIWPKPHGEIVRDERDT
jgi:hypothetical protein